MLLIIHTHSALGVLCCFALFVRLTLLASFFLPSHLSFKNMYIVKCTYAQTLVPYEVWHWFIGIIQTTTTYINGSIFVYIIY